MNARTETFDLNVLGGQIPEVCNSMFHTILFLRSAGKYNYKAETSYSIGPVGARDEECDFLDLTYTRADSDELDQLLKQEVDKFNKALRFNDTLHSGEITLTFYQKKQKRWPFSQECIPWEMWTLNLKVIQLPNEHERNAYRTNLGMAVGEKVMYITEIMSRDQYVPKNPNLSELDNVFDSSFPTVQPYLFKIEHAMQAPSSNVSGTMKKFLKDTFAL